MTGFALLSGALVAVSQHRIRPIDTVLTQRWLRAMGKYSYGMYVYQFFVFWGVRSIGSRIALWAHLNVLEQTAVFFFEVIALFLVAKLSYGLYESKFLRMKAHFVPRYAEARQSA